jgi:hypothetical protein
VLEVKEPQAPGLPQVTDQFIKGFEVSLVIPAITGVEALIAREVGRVLRNKTEIGFVGKVSVRGARPHPGNPPIIPMPMRRRIGWRLFMVRLLSNLPIHGLVSYG